MKTGIAAFSTLRTSVGSYVCCYCCCLHARPFLSTMLLAVIRDTPENGSAIRAHTPDSPTLADGPMKEL